MSHFSLVSLLFIAVAFGLVCGDKSVESSSLDNKTEKAEENTNSVKTKRGIFNHAIPYGHNYVSYSPYAKFPGIYKGFNSLSYALTPGNAVVHSYNANYPKIYVPKPSLRPIIPPPLLVHSKPILPISSVPIYAKRFPVFFQKSVLLHRPQFVPPPFVPAIPSNIPPLNPIPISIPNVLPQSAFISQNGWKPVFSTVQSVQTPSLVNPPAVTVLPPFASSSSPSQITGSHAPNNYYLPPDSTFHSVGPQLQTFRDNGLSHSNGNLLVFSSRILIVNLKNLHFRWNLLI